MTLCDYFGKRNGWDIRILASDVDTEVLAQAEQGIYSQSSVTSVPERLRKQFLREGKGSARGTYRVSDDLREMITFRRINFNDRPWPIQTKFDFIEKLMALHPMPVVMVSSLTERGCETTLRTLELGAVDFISKPKLDVRTGTLDLAEEIREKVKTAARAQDSDCRRLTDDPDGDSQDAGVARCGRCRRGRKRTSRAAGVLSQ